MAIEWTETKNGFLLSVKAQPGARRNEIVGEHGGALKVAVTEKPEQGRATAAIAEAIADSLGIAKSNVTLQSGASSRQKKFLIAGVTAEEMRVWLERFSDTGN